MPGDDPHLGRNGPILQGMSVNQTHAGIVLHPPAPVLGAAAECNLFVIEEEILVHPFQLGHHPAINKHARSCDPVDRAGPNSPTGLVFPASARYELLANCSCQAGEDADRALRGAVGVPQPEADDSGRSRRLPVVAIDPLDDLADHSTFDLHIRIQHEQPGASGQPPAGVDAHGETAVIRPDQEPQAGRRRAPSVVPGSDLADALSTTTT